VDPQRLGQRVVDQEAVVPKLLPQHLLALASSKWVGGAPARCSSCSGCATATSEAGGEACDVEASASCVGHCDITQPPSRITSTSGVRSGAGAGWLPNWPHPGGASSSATSPAASRSPAGWLSGRACPCPWEGAWGTRTCDVTAADTAASSCCGLRARHGH
jgi:hypothetical protein